MCSMPSKKEFNIYLLYILKGRQISIKTEDDFYILFYFDKRRVKKTAKFK